MPEQDPYASIAKPLSASGSDPYASMATDSTPQPSTGQTLLRGAKDFGKGLLKGAGSTVLNIDQAVNKIPGVGPYLSPQKTIDYEQAHTQPHGTMQNIGKGVEQAGEFLIPGGAEEQGGKLLAKAIPYGEKALPLIKAGTSALSAGAVNKAHGGSFGLGAAAGAGGSLIGQGAAAVAPKIAEKAIGIGRADRGFGKDAGSTILNETTGIRPGTIADQAQAKIANLSPQVDALAANSPATGSLIPARNAVGGDIAKATTRNAGNTVGQMQPMHDFLNRRFDTGATIPQDVPASELLNLRRGFDDEFGHWNPDTLPGVAGTSRQGYHALTDEFHRAVPESQELDQRISNLIPVRNAAERTTRNESTVPRVLGRFGAHTGALSGGLFGGGVGYKEGGVPGAVVGGLTGLVAPELIATPEGRMIAARTLASPATRGVGKLIQGGALQANRKDAQ